MTRYYRGFTIYRHSTEKTLSIWQDGVCIESGFPGMIAAKNWINARIPPLWSVSVVYRRPSGKRGFVTRVIRATDETTAIAQVIHSVTRFPERRKIATWLRDESRAIPIE